MICPACGFEGPDKEGCCSRCGAGPTQSDEPVDHTMVLDEESEGDELSMEGHEHHPTTGATAMSTWSSIVIVLVVAVMTYAMRAGVIVALAGRPIPVPVERALRYVGPSVLAALAINLAAGGDGGPHLEIAEAAALIVAGGSPPGGAT